MARAKAKRVVVPGKVLGLTLLPFAIPKATRNRLAAEPPATVSADGTAGRGVVTRSGRVRGG